VYRIEVYEVLIRNSHSKQITVSIWTPNAASATLRSAISWGPSMNSGKLVIAQLIPSAVASPASEVGSK
jgi:hypothetical protein